LIVAAAGAGARVKKLIMAAAMCVVVAVSQTAFGQSRRVAWDGTWVGGWDRGAGVQVIFAGDTLIGFYLRDDYKEILRSTVSADGGRTLAWDKGEATLSRSPGGEAQLVLHEHGKPDVSIPLKRE
jgi:hypothetical protein